MFSLTHSVNSIVDIIFYSAHNRPMKCTFKDKRLALIQTQRAAETGLPVAAISLARGRLTLLAAAPDERSLRNWKSLAYSTINEPDDGARSVRLNDDWRMMIQILNESEPPTILIEAIVGYN